MNNLQHLEKSLAHLLGWVGLQSEGEAVMGMRGGNTLAEVPKWCSDDAAAFQLMVEHECWVWSSQLEGILASSYGVNNKQFEAFDEHPDKATAVRVAIVKAVIAKLKETK